MAGGIFDGMSHERMLQWLDQANSGTVQSAADRLATVAEEIHKIADELKIRPQWVEWKGEGADAFRAWTADLANSTLRLGDFSESSAKWLAQASDAIARAQAAIPRTAEGAQANLDAATVAHNDPDADTISAKSAAELAALAAGKEKVRQEAAAEMVKLGQAYEFSAVQLNALERPRFAPPPTAIVPAPVDGQNSDLARPSASAQSAVSTGEVASLDSGRSRDATSGTSDVRRSLDLSSGGCRAVGGWASDPDGYRFGGDAAAGQADSDGSSKRSARCRTVGGAWKSSAFKLGSPGDGEAWIACWWPPAGAGAGGRNWPYASVPCWSGCAISECRACAGR